MEESFSLTTVSQTLMVPCISRGKGDEISAKYMLSFLLLEYTGQLRAILYMYVGNFSWLNDRTYRTSSYS